MRRVPLITAASVLFFGCSATEELTAVITDRTSQVVFFAIIDSHGQPTRLTATFGTKDGQLSFGALPQIELEGEDKAIMVQVREDALSAEFRYDVARAEEVAVRLEAPPESQVLILADSAARAEGKLPSSGVRFLDPELGSAETSPEIQAAIRGLTRLSVPVDLWDCPAPGPLTPYGASKDLLSDFALGMEPAADRLFRVVRIDSGRVLAMSPMHIFVFKRAEPFEPPARVSKDPSVYVSAASFEGRNAHLLGLAVDFDASESNGKLRVVVTGETVGGGAVWELFLGPNGLESSPHAATSSVTIPLVATFPETLVDVAIDDGGRTAILGLNGSVFLGERGSLLDGQRIDHWDTSSDGAHRIIWTKNTPFPWMVGSDNMLFVYEAATRQWSPEPVGPKGVSDVKFKGIVGEPEDPDGGLRAWAGGSNGEIFRRTEAGVFDFVDLLMPLESRGCGTALQPLEEFPPLVRDILQARIRSEFVYLLLHRCSAIVQVSRSDDHCVSLATPNGDPPELHEPGDYRAFDVGDGELVVVGNRGAVYSAPIP